MAQFKHHFTLEEANARLTWVRSVFAKVHRMLARLSKEAMDGEPKQPAGVARRAGNGNGHPHVTTPEPGETVQVDKVWPGLGHQDKVKLINGMLQGMIDQGIVIQDIERGLIDFPSWREGGEVLLCYELSDGSLINYWHDLEAGYAGRRPIDHLTE